MQKECKALPSDSTIRRVTNTLECDTHDSRFNEIDNNYTSNGNLQRNERQVNEINNNNNIFFDSLSSCSANKISEGIKESTKSFSEESEAIQKILILTWIIGDDFDDTILHGQGRIYDISDRINYMQADEGNTFLRLFEDDILEHVKDYFTTDSWNMLTKFAKENENKVWKCGKCYMDLTTQKNWRCDRCLLWFHSKCTKYFKAPRSNDLQIWFCSHCFFGC